MKTKNFLLFLIIGVLLLFLFFYSCKKDQNTSSVNNDLTASNNLENENNNNDNKKGSSNSENELSEIKWDEYDKLNEVYKSNEKYVMLFFYADWCTYCKKMMNTTFKDQKVINLLNDNFISIKINGESDKPLSKIDKNITGTSLLRYYQITGFPTMIFLDKKGKPLTALPGYVESDIFINILKYIYTESYLKESFESFQNNSN